MATTYRQIGVENIEIAYSSPTFTIQGTGGRALSSSNPGLVTMMSSTTPGQTVTVPVTANQTFIDDGGASEIINNLFGVTTGVAWANALPFFLYAVVNDSDNAIAFMIGRYPHLKKSPAFASIGAPDDAVADTELSLWSLENIDETLYDSNPCLCIGSFRMVMSTLDDWTVQALDEQDGIELFNDDRFFTMPLAQNGASAGTYFTANGGTAPVFATNTYSYKVAKNGKCTIFTNIRNDGGTDGAGAVAAQMTMPYTAIATDAGANNQAMAHLNTITNGGFEFVIINFNTGANVLNFADSSANTILNSDFASGDRDIIFAGSYDLPSF